MREAGRARPEDAAAPGVKRGVRAGDEATGRASHGGRERGGAGRRKGTAGGRAGSSRAPAERGPASRGRSEGRRRVPPAPQPALHPAPPFCASPCVSGQRRSLRSRQLPPVRRAAPSMASFPPTVNEKLIGEGRARRGSGTGAGGSVPPARSGAGSVRRGRTRVPPVPAPGRAACAEQPGDPPVTPPRCSGRRGPAAEAAAAINGQNPVKLRLGVKCSHIFI